MIFKKTKDFLKAIRRLHKKYPSIAQDLATLLTELETNPFQGDPLGDNSYKVRMAITSKGKGKSGGVSSQGNALFQITKRLVFKVSGNLISDRDKRLPPSVPDLIYAWTNGLRWEFGK